MPTLGLDLRDIHTLLGYFRACGSSGQSSRNLSGVPRSDGSLIYKIGTYWAVASMWYTESSYFGELIPSGFVALQSGCLDRLTGKVPPEVNKPRMHVGPGPDPAV